MVKLKKINLKELKKLAKNQNESPTNKVLKKKLKAEKKVTFRKEALLKDAVKNDSLVKNSKSDILKNLLKEPKNKREAEIKSKKPKQKSVEKKKKRQKTQVYDTKLILSLMKKKFNENEET